VFTRTEGVVELRASANVEFGETITVVSGSLDCSGETTPVLASAEKLTINVKGVLSRGWHSVCAGGRKVAFIYAQPPISCKFESDAAPCKASVCADESSEACMQLVAEYCAANDEEACDDVVLNFVRPMGVDVTVHVHAASDKVRFASTSCGGCDAAGCDAGPSISLLSADLEDGALSVLFRASAVGEVELCYGDRVAAVTIVSQCAFDPSASPCSADFCEDPNSEACMKAVAAYCASNTDPG
jgi:hypothetical protein